MKRKSIFLLFSLLCSSVIGFSSLGIKGNLRGNSNILNAAEENIAIDSEIKFITNTNWNSANFDLVVEFMGKDYNEKVPATSLDDNGKKYWSIKVTDNILNKAEKFKLLRCEPNNHGNCWNYTKEIGLDKNCSLYGMLYDNYWNDSPLEKYFLEEHYTYDVPPKIDSTNRNSYVDLFLNRNNNFASEEYSYVINAWKGESADQKVSFSKPANTYKLSDNTELLHFLVKRDALVGGTLQAQIFKKESLNNLDYYGLHKVSNNHNYVEFDSNKLNETNFASKICYVDKWDNGQYNLGFGALLENQNITADLAKALFAGKDSCSKDPYYGCGDLNTFINTWHLDNVRQTILKDTLISDNKVGETTTFTCAEKLIQMEATAKAPANSNSTNYLNSNDNFVTVLSICLISVLFAALGLVIVKKRRA